MVIGRSAVVVAERYTSVVKALKAIKAKWSVPSRSEQLNLVDESRSGAKFVKDVERLGDVDAGLAASDYVLSETYTTQYTTLAQIETDTAVVRLDDGGRRITAWVSSQYPYRAREEISRCAKIPETNVHVIAMPVGGGIWREDIKSGYRRGCKNCTFRSKPCEAIVQPQGSNSVA